MTEPASVGPSRRTDVLSGFLIVLLAAGVVWIAAGFPSLPEGHPGPALFPYLIAAGLLVSGIVLVARGFSGTATPPAPRQELRWPRVLRLTSAVVLVGLFPWLSGLLGFVAASALVAFAVALLLGARPIPAAAVTVGASLAIYWLFTSLLGVPL